LIRQDVEAYLKKTDFLEVFIDEVQKVPAILSGVHYLIETWNAPLDCWQRTCFTYLREEIQAEALTRSLDSFHRFLDVISLCNKDLVTHGKFYLFDPGVVSALNNTLTDPLKSNQLKRSPQLSSEGLSSLAKSFPMPKK
jgi:hypothetical protein